MEGDTIAAVSTAVGEGGIGIVRLSGSQAGPILRRLFRRADGCSLGRLPARRLLYGYIVDPSDRGRVDEVLASFMPAPHSYTREDVAEIDCHGGPLAVQRVLELVLASGARPAQPGEFTMRAFLNGRIDLSQAEAVMDVVRARTAAGLRLAECQLAGSLSAAVRQARRPLVSALAYLTALVDFPEDEVPAEEMGETLDASLAQVRTLLESADDGMVYRQGVRAAIVGRPNVGKSSLLNALLRQSRAIVAPVPGTTRDTVEEVLNLKGIAVALVDTAGITKTADSVELMGVERSRLALSRADLVLLVVDASEPLREEDREIARLVQAPAIIVANKSDLSSSISPAELASLRPGAPIATTSMLTGEGLSELEEAMAATIVGQRVYASDALLVSNPRHKEALQRAASHLAEARSSLAGGAPADLIIVHLGAAVAALGEITGETIGDELLETIFSRFCVGK